MSAAQKKDVNFEINLLPVISILAICICFLLMTAVWTLIGSLDLKQASGTIPMLTDQTPVLIVSLSENSVGLQLKNAQKQLRTTLDPRAVDSIRKNIAAMKASQSDVNSAIVLSDRSISYQRIISAIEILKKQGFAQVGLSSL